MTTFVLDSGQHSGPANYDQVIDDDVTRVTARISRDAFEGPTTDPHAIDLSINLQDGEDFLMLAAVTIPDGEINTRHGPLTHSTLTVSVPAGVGRSIRVSTDFHVPLESQIELVTIV